MAQGMGGGFMYVMEGANAPDLSRTTTWLDPPLEKFDNRGAQAFQIGKTLVEKGIVKLEKVGDFIALVDGILEAL